MDPLIESDDWQDFHVGLTVEIARQIGPQLPDHYRLSAELVVKENEALTTEDKPHGYRPDVVGVAQTAAREPTEWEAGGTATLTLPSRQAFMPIPKQREIRIRDTRNRRLITAIEVLSPSNKRLPGNAAHAQKLRSYWSGPVNTIDIDLLRGGSYPYAHEELQLKPEDESGGPYRIISITPPETSSVWEFGLMDPLPVIPIPLIHYDAPVVLDLQHALTELYAYSTYPKRRGEDLERLQPALAEEEIEALREYL